MKVKNISFSYKPFFELLKSRGYTKDGFANEFGISRSTMYGLKKGDNITIHTLLKLMVNLNVSDINEILEIKVIE